MDNPYNPSSLTSQHYYQSISTTPTIWANAGNSTTLTLYPTIATASPLPEPKRSGPEDPIEWLHRRVREIEWYGAYA